MTEKRLRNFDPHAIADSGQCFRFETLSPDSVRLTAMGRRLTVQKTGADTFRFDCDEQTFERVWQPYFDLETDYAAIGARIPPEDAFLTEAYRFGEGLRILRQDPWETLVSFIISQNNNIPRIRGAVEAICARWGTKACDADGTYFLFPTARQLSAATEAELRACGLGYRAPYLMKLAQEPFDAGALSALEDDALRQALTSFTGVGPKVAQCVMLFGFHRMEAFPVDTWIRRALATRYPQGFPAQQYEGCGGVIQQYMFFYERSLGKRKGRETG